MKKSIRKRVLGVEIEFHPVVFPVGAGLILTFVALAVFLPHRALMTFNEIKDSITKYFSWLYILSMSGFLVFALYLPFSRFGSIKLGAADEEPEFSRLTWFAMLFSAGMGIGMLFFGVAEPMHHYVSPLDGGLSPQGTARQSMAITLVHWCLHPWALYATVALCLAYFGFRRGLPLSFRSVFYPLFGKRIYGLLGDVIDILALMATLFGLATSLGLGAKQVNAGLTHVFGLPQGTMVQIILIACITAMAVASLVSGLHVGIRRLSEANIGLAMSLLLFLFVAGPTIYLLNALVNNVGAYVQALPKRAFLTAAYSDPKHSTWLGDWTIFYWGWWIAWSPFVGMFIARVSRGRTIREFVGGVLLIPTAVSVVWMTGFGNTALHQEVVTKNKRSYPVMVTEEKHGLPVTQTGALTAPDALGVASPKQILVRKGGRGGLISAARGKAVTYKKGVLVAAQSGRPYRPAPKEIYRGRYRSHKKQLTLGQYLDLPVLNAKGTGAHDTTATAMFVMLEAYPLSWLTALLGTLCIILFFVTSSDSASLVADMIASGGSKNPTLGTRLFWGILEGVLAAVLLMAGGLVALQTGSITLGLPFCLLIILMCFSLVRGMRRDLAGQLPQKQRAHLEGKRTKAAAPKTGQKAEDTAAETDSKADAADSDAAAGQTEDLHTPNDNP
jgi:choline/carnitine/betaine transport